MIPPDDVLWTLSTVSGLSAQKIADTYGVGRSAIADRLTAIKARKGQHREQIKARSMAPRSRQAWIELQARLVDQALADIAQAREGSVTPAERLACAKQTIALARFAADMTAISKDDRGGTVQDRPDLLERLRAATASAEPVVH